MNQIKKIADDLHYKEIPRLVLRLGKTLFYRNDCCGVLHVIERVIHPSLHMFSPEDLLTLFYAMTFKSPKMFSLPLRNQIFKLIQDDFKHFSFHELQLYMCALSQNRKIPPFLTLLETLKTRKDDFIQHSRTSKNVSFLINTFYLYLVCKIPANHRKTRGIDKDVLKETAEVLYFYLDEWIDRFDEIKQDKTTIYRLVYSLKESKIPEINELYRR